MSNRRGLKTPVLGRNTKAADKPVVETAPAAEESSRKALRPAVLKYLNGHIGTPIHVDEMVVDLARPKSSIQNVMAGLIKEGLLNIAILSHGNSWIYRGLLEDAVVMAAPIETAPAPAKGETRMYEEMGTDKDGRRILKDENGVLWAATEL